MAAVNKTMNAPPEDIQRLALLIRRILDAEVLYEIEVETLLTTSEAAYRALAEGDSDTARMHLEQLILFTEALIAADALPDRDGHAVIQLTGRLLKPETDADTVSH